MSALEKLFELPQYSISSSEKKEYLLDELNGLTEFHASHCSRYSNILKTLYKNFKIAGSLENVPYFPVRLFKSYELKSISDEEILRVLTSSGTTSQQVSKIFVNRETSLLQTKALASIVTHFIGPKRLPMVFVDSEATVRNISSMNARSAGLIGLSNFGRSHFYALDDDMRLNIDELLNFINRFPDEPILIFGFTFMLWKHFYQELKNLGLKINLPNAVLIHSGGWKKLEQESVDNATFKAELFEQCGIRKIHNFYGMVEQVGSIFMECEHGYLHTPNFSDIIIRDFKDWSVLENGKSGIIQTLSVLPKSYPGHSLLTEDMGTVIGEDDCKCGRKGKYFMIQSRIPQSELRGCSDVYAQGENSL